MSSPERFGVSAIVLASAELFTALKLVGAAYLVWLCIRTVQIASRAAHAALIQGETAARDRLAFAKRPA